jgi:hypothetical protein
VRIASHITSARSRAATAALAGLLGIVGLTVAFVSTSSAQATQTITVEPSTDLQGDARVTVSGTGWPLREPVGLAMCAATFVNNEGCDFGTLTIADADVHGAFSVPFGTHDVITTPTNGTFSCAPDKCLLLAGDMNSGTVIVKTPLTFVGTGDVATTSILPSTTISQQSATTVASAPGDHSDESDGDANPVTLSILGALLVLAVVGSVQLVRRRRRAD